MKNKDMFALKTITILIISILLLILCNCEFNTSSLTKEQNESSYKFVMDSLSVDELYELIYDRWNWIYSIIMQRHLQPPDNKITPDKVGYTFQREFKNTKQVDNYTNDAYSGTQSFSIKRFKILDTDSGYVTEIYLDSTSYQLRFLHPDTMMIGNGWRDGIDQYYVRIN
jgi:hypothetical protein